MLQAEYADFSNPATRSISCRVGTDVNLWLVCSRKTFSRMPRAYLCQGEVGIHLFHFTKARIHQHELVPQYQLSLTQLEADHSLCIKCTIDFAKHLLKFCM